MPPCSSISSVGGLTLLHLSVLYQDPAEFTQLALILQRIPDPREIRLLIPKDKAGKQTGALGRDGNIHRASASHTASMFVRKEDRKPTGNYLSWLIPLLKGSA